MLYNVNIFDFFGRHPMTEIFKCFNLEDSDDIVVTVFVVVVAAVAVLKDDDSLHLSNVNHAKLEQLAMDVEASDSVVKVVGHWPNAVATNRLLDRYSAL